MATDPDAFQSLIQNALSALKRGEKNAARNFAEQAAALDPGSEEPWLILAALASQGQSLAYIKKALRINPESQRAQQALEWAQHRQRQRPQAPEKEAPLDESRLASRIAIPADQVPLPIPASKQKHHPVASDDPADFPTEKI